MSQWDDHKSTRFPNETCVIKESTQIERVSAGMIDLC